MNNLYGQDVQGAHKGFAVMNINCKLLKKVKQPIKHVAEVFKANGYSAQIVEGNYFLCNLSERKGFNNGYYVVVLVRDTDDADKTVSFCYKYGDTDFYEGKSAMNALYMYLNDLARRAETIRDADSPDNLLYRVQYGYINGKYGSIKMRIGKRYEWVGRVLRQEKY